MENPTSEEKILATLAHASVLFSGFGPIGPTIIWAWQRSKSRYVRFHALQAMGYQALGLWGFLIGVFMVAFGAFFVLVFIGAIFAERSSDFRAIPFFIEPIIILCILGLWGIFFAGGAIGAVCCMANRSFRYPIIGRWLEQKVFDAKLTEHESDEWEDNWVSGVCHSTAIIQLWGIVTSLIVWFSQKKRSAKLRFQALQATIYQLLAFVAYMIGMAVYMAFFLMLTFSLLAAGGLNTSAPRGEFPPAVGWIFMVFFVLLMIFWFLMMIGTPIYFLLSAIASFLTIRGRDFKYPILGGVILRRMAVPK